MEVIRGHTVKTRKDHQCIGCLDVIAKGTTVEMIVYKDGGDIYTIYWCDVCTVYWARHCHHGDECGEGGLKQEDPEGWEEIRAELAAKAEATA